MFVRNKEIIAVFGIAVLVGFIIVFPAIYFHFFNTSYRGVEFLGSDAEIGYLSQAEEIADGHFNLGNPYLVDFKDKPYVQQPLSPMVLAAISVIFGLSIPQAAIVGQFIFPALLTIIIYFFFRHIMERKKLALFAAIFIMMASASLIFMNPRAWLPFFVHGEFIGTDPQFLSYARAINPQTSSLFFFGYLLFLYKYLYSAEVKKIFGVFAVLLLGLSFYTYFFTFSFLFTFNACALFVFWYQKDRLRFRRLFIITLAALVIGIPYFINVYNVFRDPAYVEVSRRLGTIGSHKFVFSRVWWIVLLLFLFARKKGLSISMRHFIVSFLGAALIVTNQQVITGYTVPIPSHYHWYFIAPIGGVIALYLLFIYFEKKIRQNIYNLFLLAGSLLFIIAGAMFQKYSYAAQYNFFIDAQRYGDVIKWVRSLPKESVIFGNEDISSYVPAYTHSNVYYNHYEADFLTDQNRLMHSYFIYLYLRGITNDNIRDFLKEPDNKGLMGGAIFGQYYRNLKGCYGCFDDTTFDAILENYRQFLSKPFLFQLNKYSVNYIVWDKIKDPEWRMNRFFNKKLYEQNNIVVYEP